MAVLFISGGGDSRHETVIQATGTSETGSRGFHKSKSVTVVNTRRVGGPASYSDLATATGHQDTPAGMIQTVIFGVSQAEEKRD